MSVQALGHQLVMIDEFLIDVSLSEEHSFESEVTEYPVEKGADITDNIRPKPIQITMEGLVSNTPINPDIISARDAADQSVDDAYATFMKIRDDRETVTIRTSLRTYENMAMKNLVIPRQPGQADSLRFTATFVQVLIVSNTRTTRVSTPIAVKPKLVQKPPEPAADTFNDSLPFYSVIGITRLGFFDYLWYDADISGWREGVVHDAPRNVNTGDAEPAEGWVLYKGRPYGATTSQWATVQSDSFWSAQISAATEANKNNPFGNPFNPFDDLSDNVISDVKKVHAMRR